MKDSSLFDLTPSTHEQVHFPVRTEISQLNTWNSRSTFALWYILRAFLRGHKLLTCCSKSFPCVTFHLLPKRHVAGTNFPSPATCCMKFIWSEFICHEKQKKWPHFSVLHYVHCSCKMSPLQHNYFKQESGSCAPACVVWNMRPVN